MSSRTSKENSVPSASERLRIKKEEIIQKWVSKISTSLSAAKAKNEPHLRNSVPHFIDELVTALASVFTEKVSYTALKEVSEGHGGQRSSLEEYSLYEMLLEYQYLREIIISELEVDGPINTMERNIILTAIEQGMVNSGSIFSMETQKKIAEQERHYRSVVEGVQDHAIIRIDTNGIIHDWNTGAELIFQYKKEEIINQDSRILFIPEDNARGVSKQEIKTAINEGKAEDKRWHIKRDGSVFFANGIMNPLKDERGEVYGFVKVLRDDTKRRELEERLRILSYVAEQSSDFIGIATPEGKSIFLNKAGQKLIGSEKLPSDIMEHFLEEDKKFVKDVILPTQDKEGHWEGEFRFKHFQTGEAIPVLYNQFVISNENGEKIGIATVTRDLRQEKKSEEQLEKARRQLHDFFMQTPTPLAILTGPEFRFNLTNPPFNCLVKKEVLGRTVRDVFQNPKILQSLPIMEKVYKTGEPFVWRELEITIFEEEHYFNVSFTALRNVEGKINAITALILDITEQVKARKMLEKSEERFREMADALPLIMWTSKPNGFVDWYNKWYWEYTGLREGSNWDDLDVSPIHPQDLAQLSEKWSYSLKTGQPTNIEFRIKRYDDQYRWHLSRGVPIKNSQGVILRWVGSNTDIHEQKVFMSRLEEERELRERFVAALSHDLRTPLASAKMSAQFLKKRRSSDEMLISSTDKIISSVERVDDMIQNLLDVNRITAGEKLPLRRELCGLTNILHNTIDELNYLHGARFTLLEEKSDIEGLFDANGIKRMLENLCNNAAKYSTPDSPIQVQTKKIPPSQVQISVHNTGNPISPEDQKQLFMPYKRASSVLNSNKKGWGLGLSLVKAIVDAHGGVVAVKSNERDGTTFLITLPINRVGPGGLYDER